MTRLSYLLSDFALKTSQGEWMEINGSPAYLDLAKQRTSFTLTNVPEDEYLGLRFSVGLETKTNHGDPSKYPAQHPLNPNFNQLHWDWKSGYIFLALEGRYQTPRRLEGFVFHLANSGNKTQVTLLDKIEHREHTELNLGFNLANLFKTPDPISFAQDGASTHSHPKDPLVHKLVGNIPNAFRVITTQVREAIASPKLATPVDFPEQWEAHPFVVGRNFPIPQLPSDNPLIKARVALGKKLFFDPLLSKTNSLSCASCHDPKHAFSDSRKQSIGIHGISTPRHSMPLFNLAWKNSFLWDGKIERLRDQVLEPIENPDEMGENLSDVIAKLEASNEYVSLFKAAYKSGDLNPENLSLAIEAFLLTLVSYDSKFDRALKGEAELTDSEKRGFELFMTEHEPRSKKFGADCFHCHGGPLFTNHNFHNNGLAESTDPGRSGVTGRKSDSNKFAAPSLRNIALTAPYMHDGRLETLEAVVEHYNSGILNSDTLDPNLAKHPKSGLNLGVEDQAALVDFLKTLTDPKFQLN